MADSSFTFNIPSDDCEEFSIEISSDDCCSLFDTSGQSKEEDIVIESSCCLSLSNSSIINVDESSTAHTIIDDDNFDFVEPMATSTPLKPSRKSFEDSSQERKRKKTPDELEQADGGSKTPVEDESSETEERACERPLATSTPLKASRKSSKDSSQEKNRKKTPDELEQADGGSKTPVEDESSETEERACDRLYDMPVPEEEGHIPRRAAQKKAKKPIMDDIKEVKKKKCCQNRCVETMDEIEMCLARKNFQDMTKMDKKEAILSYLWEHCLLDISDCDKVPYYIRGYCLCLVAYREVLGIPKIVFDMVWAAFKRGQTTLKGNSVSRQSKKRLQAVAWMHSYFKRIGDKMPDYGGIHLPAYLDYSRIYKFMKADLEARGLLPTISYGYMCTVMEEEFSNVKIPKVDRFTRCDYCTMLQDEKEKAKDPAVRLYLDKLFKVHNDLQMKEREIYYRHRDRAFESGRAILCLAQDAMDQAKLLLPNVLKINHAVAGARQLHTHLTAVLNDGYRPSGYIDVKQYPHDSNLTMNILLLELNKMRWVPDTFYYHLDNCWRENKNQHVLHFLAVLVRLDIFKKVKVNFLMVGHTHEAVDQLFNKFAAVLRKQNTLTLSALKSTLEQCYTPSPEPHEVTKMYDIRKWLQSFCEELHGITNPHVFRITKAPSGKVVMQYKNWQSVKEEAWKPNDIDPDNWIALLQENVEVPLSECPEIVAPDLNKMEFSLISKDIQKYFDGCRLFGDEEKNEWSELLSNDHDFFSTKVREEAFEALENLVKKKREQSTGEQITLGLVGERPNGVSDEVENRVLGQFGQIPQVYCGPYRRPTTVQVVDNYAALKNGDFVAVNLQNYDKLPCIGKAIEVRGEEFVIEWWKGGYRKVWEKWPNCGTEVLPVDCVILFAFNLAEDGKLTRDTSKNLKTAYTKLKSN